MGSLSQELWNNGKLHILCHAFFFLSRAEEKYHFRSETAQGGEKKKQIMRLKRAGKNIQESKRIWHRERIEYPSSERCANKDLLVFFVTTLLRRYLPTSQEEKEKEKMKARHRATLVDKKKTKIWRGFCFCFVTGQNK